ncbi:hypothetical protein AAK899_12165 [Erysipelotrichaceae bacterium 51-3]
MILGKTLLAVTLLTASMPTINSVSPLSPVTQEVQPRLFGTLTSGWLTSTDGNVQVKVSYTHELATNRIVYINSIVACRYSNGAVVSQYWLIDSSVSGNTAVINVGYLAADSSTRLGVFHLIV